MMTLDREEIAPRGEEPTRPGSAREDAVRDRAASWVVRLQDPALEDSDFLAFDAWLSASAQHRQAYDQALEAWLGVTTSVSSAARLTAPPAPRRQRSSRAWQRTAVWVASAAATAAALMVIAPLAWRLPVAGTSTTYQTMRGERRLITLADGTRIHLNAATQIDINLGPGQRVVKMVEGEASFDIKHGRAAPLVVATRGGLVRDLGTEFDVRQRGQALSVMVSRGQVSFEPAGALRGPPVSVTPGQKLERLEGTTSARVHAVVAEDELAWRKGELVLRNQPLSAVVAELNLYFDRPLRIDDPALAARPVSGVIRLGDQSGTLRLLGLLAPLKAVQRGNDVLLAPLPG